MNLYAINGMIEAEERYEPEQKGTTLNDQPTPQRPAVMDELSETQLKELEFQAEEYDWEDFFRVAGNYGWNDETAREVWKWFEVMPTYPLDKGTDG